MLADHEIQKLLDTGDLVIRPYHDSMLQPASVELTLGNEFMWYRGVAADPFHFSSEDTDLGNHPIDPYQGVDEAQEMTRVRIEPGGAVVLEPGEFCLAATKEYVKLGDSISAQVNGKSTIGRLGLIVHATAGFVDPKFEGFITLEIANHNNVRPIELIPGMPIAQLSFFQLSGPVMRPYGDKALGSHYQNQEGVRGPRPLRRMVN